MYIQNTSLKTPNVRHFTVLVSINNSMYKLSSMMNKDLNSPSPFTTTNMWQQSTHRSQAVSNTSQSQQQPSTWARSPFLFVYSQQFCCLLGISAPSFTNILPCKVTLNWNKEVVRSMIRTASPFDKNYFFGLSIKQMISGFLNLCKETSGLSKNFFINSPGSCWVVLNNDNTLAYK